jgi:hypothetical protein
MNEQGTFARALRRSARRASGRGALLERFPKAPAIAVAR